MANKVRVYFILSVACYVVCMVGAVVVFIWSATQVSNHEVTRNGTTILNGKTRTDRPCTRNAKLEMHRPLRFYLNNDPGQLGCGWSPGKLAARMGIAAAAAIFLVPSFIFTMVKRSKLTYIGGIVLLAGGVGFSWLLIQDAKTVGVNASWCSKGMPDVGWAVKPAKITCSNWPFSLLCVFDGLCAVVYFALGVVSVLYMCNAGPRSPGEKRLLPTGEGADEPFPAEQPSGDSAVPTETAVDSPRTPLVSKQHPPQDTGFNFESRASRHSPAPPAEAAPAPVVQYAEPATAAPSAKAKPQSKPSAPPPSSGQFDFESASQAAPSADLDFSTLGARKTAR